MYQTSPKIDRELKRVAEAYGETIPKPTKAYGTRWIDHKLRAMQIALDHYGPLIHHIKSLLQTDSQPKQRAQLSGFLKRWKHAVLPLSMSIYLDVLSPLHNMSLSFQKDRHDPVKAFRRVQDFNWNMAKLQLLIEDSWDSPNSIMTTYKKFLRQIIEKESENDGKIRYFYQDLKLKKFQISKNNVKENYTEAIRNITACMEEHFSNLYESPLFKNMVCMLDVSTWLTASSTEKFGDQEISEMTNYFANLFSSGPPQVDKIPQKWLFLKSYMLPIISNNKKTYYLNIWKIVFSNQGIVKECRNVFDIFELFLICPFTNAKLERMFSHMNCVKNDWRSNLSRD